MPLVRAFTKVDEKGRIPLPNNIRKTADFKPGQLVEIKVVGVSKSRVLQISKRQKIR